MTNTPNPDNEPESNQPESTPPTPPTPPPRRRRRRLWFSLTGIVLVGLGGGLTWGWISSSSKVVPFCRKTTYPSFSKAY